MERKGASDLFDYFAIFLRRVTVSSWHGSAFGSVEIQLSQISLGRQFEMPKGVLSLLLVAVVYTKSVALNRNTYSSHLVR